MSRKGGIGGGGCTHRVQTAWPYPMVGNKAMHILTWPTFCVFLYSAMTFMAIG